MGDHFPLVAWSGPPAPTGAGAIPLTDPFSEAAIEGISLLRRSQQSLLLITSFPQAPLETPPLSVAVDPRSQGPFRSSERDPAPGTSYHCAGAHTIACNDGGCARDETMMGLAQAVIGGNSLLARDGSLHRRLRPGFP